MNAVRQTTDVAGILKRLGIDSINAGAWSGTLGWSKDVAGSLITSVNPATGETLAQVRGATLTDYEAVMRSSVEAANAWRNVPAPRRGEAVRLLGEALRAAKEDLGALVTLENGKIKAEGLCSGSRTGSGCRPAAVTAARCSARSTRRPARSCGRWSCRPA